MIDHGLDAGKLFAQVHRGRNNRLRSCTGDEQQEGEGGFHLIRQFPIHGQYIRLRAQPGDEISLCR